MAQVIDTITKTLENSPLPLLVEKLAMAIAEAQVKLDQNAIELTKTLALTEVNMPDGKSYSLVALGFAPTFYSFTETTIEAKMQFSMAESEEFGISGSASFGSGSSSSSDGGKKTSMFAASISGYYASKFEASAEGASSIAVRMVAVPAPDRYQSILSQVASEGEENPLIIEAIADQSSAEGVSAVITPVVSGGNEPYTYEWTHGLGSGDTADLDSLTAADSPYVVQVRVTDSSGRQKTKAFNVEIT